MDSFELNKFAGGILAALLFLFGTKTMVDIAFEKHPLAKPGFLYEVSDSSEGTDKTGSDKSKTVAPIGVRLAKADVSKGQGISKKCKACHTFNSGGKHATGPNLYNIVNKKVASNGEFAYSSAMTEKGGTWSYEFLECFLETPKKCVEGTKMSFAGIKKPDQRADLILYLRSLSESPVALPSAP